MVEYLIELKMADRTLAITDEMERMIKECAIEANNTTVSIRNNRVFSVEKRMDAYTLVVKIQSKTSLNPTRTLSTLTRAVSKNRRMNELLTGHIVNGCIFHAKLLSEIGTNIIHLSDTEVVSEIISVFFQQDLSPKEKSLALETAETIRKTMIGYINKKNNLK